MWLMKTIKEKNRIIQPYKSREDYMDDLNRVFIKDYGVKMTKKQLSNSTINLDVFLQKLI